MLPHASATRQGRSSLAVALPHARMGAADAIWSLPHQKRTFQCFRRSHLNMSGSLPRSGVAVMRAGCRAPCPLVAGGVELRRAPALEVRRGRLARDLPVAHPSRVARRAGDRPLAPRATNTCVHGGVGAVDGLSGAADAPASPRIVVASGLMNMHGALDTGWRSPRKRLLAVGARLLARKG
jgi:hypothetical protein